MSSSNDLEDQISTARAESRAELLEVLTDLLGWELPEPRWEAVESLVGAVETALAGPDPQALRVATVAVELAGPVRITPIGTTPLLPPPPPIRERVNCLIHELTPHLPADQTTTRPKPGGAEPRPPAVG